MSDAPTSKPGNWIKVGSIDCLVAAVEADGDSPKLKVICNPDRPTVYQVVWGGEAWSFAHPMRGTYAEQSPETEIHVDAVRRGPGGKSV